MTATSGPRWLRVAEVLAVLAMAGAFAWATGLAPEWGRWYSPDPSYRLQTEAFLRGDLALQPHPYQARIDWILGRGGMHQGWGLGVPLLRLPFELGARALGGRAFPDRLVFLGLYAAVALVLVRGLGRPDRRSRSGPVPTRLAALGATGGILLCPAFLTLAHVRFAVYEEAVAYGILWALLLLGLLLHLERSPAPWRWYALALAAGFAPLVRPTGAVYGAITAALGLVLAHRARLGPARLVAGAALFLLGPVLLLASNELRFGSPFELGYSLSFSGTPGDALALRFGHPFEHVDLRTAAEELVSWIFFAERHTRVEWMRVPWAPYRAEVLRFRESYFPTFGPGALVLLGLAWVWLLPPARAGAGRLPGRVLPGGGRLLAGWSLASFALLFVFYLRSPSLSSRYTLDFLPALGAALAGLLLAVHAAASRRSARWGATTGVAIPALLALWIPLAALRSFAGESEAAYGVGPKAVGREEMEAILERRAAIRRSRDWPPLPERYVCPGHAETGIRFNLLGWDHRGGCAVDLVTQVFLRRTPCISLLVGPGGGMPAGTDLDAALENVGARVNYDPLVRRATRREGRRRRIFFCRPPASLQVDSPIQAYTIRWATVAAPVPSLSDLRLHEVRREPQGPERPPRDEGGP